MPSLIDPSLAPEGCHVIHAYVPATEPYAPWAGMDRAGNLAIKNDNFIHF